MLDERLWSTSFEDDDYASVREVSSEGGPLLRVRYARNRQVHDVDVTGMQTNPLLARHDSLKEYVWLWRALDGEGVPSYTPHEREWCEKGEAVYQNSLAGEEILETFNAASQFVQERIVMLYG